MAVAVALDYGSLDAPLTSQSRALPDGWTRGIEFSDLTCLTPVVMGECPPAPDGLKPTQRPDLDTFHPVEVIAAVECTTRGNVDVAAFASTSLDRIRDYALAREMLTGAASTRDAGTNPANPSLVDTATDLGAVFTSVAASVACLEQSLQEATSGQSGFILAGVDWASYALAERVIWRDGARWRTAGGSTVIISAGFDGRAPAATGPGVPPAAGAALYAYAVANLWAGFGLRSQYTDVNRAVNTASSRVEDVALAAFPTCAVFAAASTAATAC